MNRYTADFETTTNPDDCRVWAWGLYNIETEQFQIGNDLNAFFDLFRKKSTTVYFRNLKFDGEFILYWLFENGFEYRTDKRELATNTFTTLISDKGQWYTMTICFKKTMTQSVNLTINDSLKLLPFSIAKTAKAFGMEIQKG